MVRTTVLVLMDEARIIETFRGTSGHDVFCNFHLASFDHLELRIEPLKSPTSICLLTARRFDMAATNLVSKDWEISFWNLLR